MTHETPRQLWALALSALALATQALGGATDMGLIERWVLDQAHVKGQTLVASVGSRKGRVVGDVRLTTEPGGLVFDGRTNRVVLAEGARPAELPKREFAVEAWVSIGKPVQWAGIVGFIQDNGNFEKGWTLTTVNSQFAFGLSTQGADDGNGRATYLRSSTLFTSGNWYHVAATYDGAAQKLYVNGRLEAASKAQSGDINYPAASFYEIGSYHDATELHLWSGAIYEVRLYARALTAAEILASHKAKLPLFPQPLRLADGPYLRPVDPRTVRIDWKSARPGASAVEYGAELPLTKQAPSDGSGCEHGAVLSDLRPGTICRYRIRWTGARKGSRPAPTRTTKAYELDATFATRPVVMPRGPSPYPKDELTGAFTEAAETVSGWAPEHGRGFCLVLGCGEGRLLYEIARRTRLTLIGLEDHAAKAATARRMLDKAGIYGVRATVQHGPLSKLPFPSHFANVVVTDALSGFDGPEASYREVFRVVRPGGWVILRADRRKIIGKAVRSMGSPFELLRRSGVVDLYDREPSGRWLTLRRLHLGESEDGMLLPGQDRPGEWLSTYGDPANTACSGEGGLRGPLEIAWFGRPGPRLMIDRHHRPVPPLAVYGYLVVPADGRIIAVDHYNGTVLWELLIPGSHRAGAPSDTSYLSFDRYLYVAADDRCVCLRLATGEVLRTLRVPQLDSDSPREWGYVCALGLQVLGSARKPGASLRRRGRPTIHALYGDFREFATSDYVFSVSRESGKARWSHRSSSILDTTITADHSSLYFIESHKPDAVKDHDGRMALPTFLGEGSSLVALDIEKGTLRWKRPVDLRAVQHVLFLSWGHTSELPNRHPNGILVLLGSKNKQRRVWYDLWAFDAKTGQLIWHREQDNRKRQGGIHGEQTLHPVLVGGMVIAEPYAYHLATGKPVEGWKFSRGGGGCGTLSASAHQLFFRAGNPAMFDLGTRTLSKLTRVSRPGCWINILPVGGMVLIPEASSGCTCGYPIQASFGLVPRRPRPGSRDAPGKPPSP